MNRIQISTRSAAATAAGALGAGFCLYMFLVAVGLMGAAFKLMGGDIAVQLIETTTHPFVGLFVGILATSIIQSSSMTTSIVVGMVGSGILPITNAIPIIMGANVGTSVTNTIISMGHITRATDFRRAFAASTVHDFFNLLAVAIFLPLELSFGVLEKSARFLSSSLTGGGDLIFQSPVKMAIKPVTHAITHFASDVAGPHAGILLLAGAMILLFMSLFHLTKLLKNVFLKVLERMFSTVFFRNTLTALTAGFLFTSLVQSSSVSTSLLVPMAASGILTLRQIFPFTLGCNIGTTITALFAALAADVNAITIALIHLLFNVLGTALFLGIPGLRNVPIVLARRLALAATRRRRVAFYYVIGMFFLLPLMLIFLTR